MAEAQALSFGEGRAQRKNLTTAFDQLIDLQQAKAERYHQDAQKFMKMFELIAFLILIGMIIFCLAFAVFQARTLLKPIEQMTKELREGNVYQKQADNLDQSVKQIMENTRAMAGSAEVSATHAGRAVAAVKQGKDAVGKAIKQIK